jgi:hypothetical protein
VLLSETMANLNKIGYCKLCLKNPAVLLQSHILPEFLYEGTYDEKHRTIVVDPEPRQKDRIYQKGLREYLLCQKCEALLSSYERYGAEVLRSFPSTENQRPGEILWVRGIDYARFKVFQLSLLWRCGISKQPAFRGVELGLHEEQLRRMVLGSKAGKPWEYGCVIVGLRGPGNLKGMVKFPGRLRIDGHGAYHFVVWGLVWIYVVSSHTEGLRGKGSFLSERGDLPIMIPSETAEEFFRGLARNFSKAGKEL